MQNAPPNNNFLFDHSTMSKPKLIVIGNGMAGVKTLEHLLTIAPHFYDINVFGTELHPNYNRILLSPVLAGEMTLDDIVINDRGWYAKHGVTLHLGKTIIRIDRKRRIVIADDGTETPYDRLLLATGSSAVKLPIPGNDLKNVVTYRDIGDTETMIDISRTAKRAVVIGGGLLGLEAANGLALRGMQVTVVHVMPWLMERQLDQNAAKTLQAALEARGVMFRLAASTSEIIGTDGKVSGITFKSGEPINTDLVVMAVGIRPNVWLAESCGLQINRGIVVDDTLQTYDPRIYAVGECVAHRGVSYGLVAPLYDMAKVCATHLAEVGSHYYMGTVPSTRLKVTGVDVFSAGNFMGTKTSEAIVLKDSRNGIYRKLVIDNDLLIGSVLVGDTSAATQYVDMIAAKQNIAAMRNELMFIS
jgi:nitrite reductase (NADH) large subunit